MSDAEYDGLHLSSDAADLYVEVFYFYQGDPGGCIDGERVANAEDAGLDDLEPLSDNNGEPITGGDEQSAYGLYEISGEADDGSAYDDGMYLLCQTIVLESAVLLFSGYFALDSAVEQVAAIDEVASTVQPAVAAELEVDPRDSEHLDRAAENDIDGYWSGVFADIGMTYRDPKFITFTGPVETGCGEATSGENGPFFGGEDDTVYFDMDDISDGLLPYGAVVVQVVIAHENGHYVQSLRSLDGCHEDVRGAPGQSLAIELQADCLAGAYTQDAAARGVIQTSDFKRVTIAIRTYLADPPDTSEDDSDTHGSGDARMEVFQAGYTEGLPACDTD